MTRFSGSGILLDIEGTTSSVSYVFDVMFPFARQRMEGYLRAHWGEPALLSACEWVAKDAGAASFSVWCAGLAPESSLVRVRDECLRWMDQDAKVTGLKQLQGLVWEEGFKTGQLRSHLFADVAQALRAWQVAGIDVRIYSSGSVHAQRLFFAHTAEGDLSGLLRGHYDTTTGPKRESASYTKIAAAFGRSPGELLFLSDICAELDAARGAGMQTALCVRPGNAPTPLGHGHSIVASFAELSLQRPA